MGEANVPQARDSNETERPSLEQMGASEKIVMSVTRLLEAQRQMMAAQVQAMAAQSVSPLCKFNRDDVNTDEGSVDHWVEQFKNKPK